MKNWIVLLNLFCIACGNNATKKNPEFQLEIGDILFQDLDSSPLCDAIELVTPGYKNANFSHVGIIIEGGIPFCTNPDSRFEEKYFYNINEDFKILEALPGGVQITRIDSFLNRSYDVNKNPKVIVGRLKLKNKYTLIDAIPFLKSKIGIGYDNAFIINNNTYYCSELIYEAFERDSIFQLQPMTFLHPETKDTLSIWKEYYSSLKMKIPQNELGINPGIMSLSENIEIVHIYGTPDGMRK
jgi:hypothetical protein